MRYLIAVSGGVDSVVLLDILVKVGSYELIVAHFDHGIRSDSADDARFVEGLAHTHHLPFVAKREELGAGASEELARMRRYAFLRDQAKKNNAVLVTAHHADDVVETIAINSIRGTGWRGVAVLNAPDIGRPLLHVTKNQIRAYAYAKRLEWVEESTNASTDYLRNRIRRRIATVMSSEDKKAVLGVWKRQLILKAEVEEELKKYIRGDNEYPRYFFIQADPLAACELLRAVIMAAAQTSPTRPQVERALLAIKTAKPLAIQELGDGVLMRFTIHTFIVYTP